MLLYTTDGAGNKTSRNIIGPQENVIATIRYEDEGEHAYFYNKDIRTSVTNVIDESGSGVVSYRYDDYGTTTKYGNQDFYNEVCYTSGVYDELTGLYYLNARYYNPESAMFITSDSYLGRVQEPQTLNRYVYCLNNPISRVDPSGHDSYVFSISQFKIESSGIKNILNKYYNKKSHLKVVNSKQTFKKEWNRMKKKKIECVVINSHANPTELSTEVRDIATKSTVKSLKRKKVKRLIILGCNAGHDDYAFSNISYEFRKKVKGPVIASDGTVTSYSSTPTTETSPFSSIADDEWRWWRKKRKGKKKRKNNVGWIMYDNLSIMSYSGLKKMTIMDMCKWNGNYLK